MAILCATDFSPASRTAAALATAIAHRTRDSLALVHVVQPPSYGAPELPFDASWVLSMQTAAQEAISELAREVRASGVACQVRVMLGEPSRLILETASEQSSSLIVVGSHGRKGVARLLLGNVVETLTRGARCPVLVTPPHADLSAWTSDLPLRLAVADDGSRDRDRLCRRVEDLGGSLELDLTVVHLYRVEDVGPRSDGQADAPAHKGPRARTDRLSSRSRPRLCLACYDTDAPKALFRQLASLKPDALVLPTDRRRAHGTALPPAVVLRQSSIPVFCLPEDDAARESSGVATSAG